MIVGLIGTNKTLKSNYTTASLVQGYLQSYTIPIHTYLDSIVDRDLRLRTTTETTVICKIRENRKLGVDARGVVQGEWNREIRLFVAVEFQVP